MNKKKRCNKKVLDRRTIKDFSHNTIDIIRDVTVNMNTLPVGTFKYKVFKYPSDIDIFEPIDGCCTYNEAKLHAASVIQGIVKNIDRDVLLFSDFKAGYDSRYKIYTGIIEGDTIIDWSPVLIKRDLDNLHHTNLLTCDEYQSLIKLVIDIPTIDDVVALNEKLRTFWVIR